MGCCCGHKKVIKNDFNKLEPKKPAQVEIDNTAEIQRQKAEKQQEELRLQKLKEEEEERKRKEEEAKRKKEQEEREALERERERLRKLKEEEEIREADLLKTKAMEVNKSYEPPIFEPTEEEIDEKNFTKLMQNIRELVPVYEKSQKDSFSTICTKSINDTSSSGAMVSNRLGPQIKNKRICDIQQGEKYDFSKEIKAKSFTEYKENDLILERLLEKPKHSVCSYLGKIQGKYCCVKLIPCVQLQEAKRWIAAVDKYQKEIVNVRFMENFKFYSYYKLEDVEKTHVNIYVISNLEQYNAYTLATDEKITIEQKARVMYLSIGILKTVIISKYQQQNEQQQQQGRPEIIASNKLLEQVQKNIYTVKNNNILITFTQKEQKVYLADWQLLVEEFQNIIPYKQIQSQDLQMQETLLEASNNKSLHQQSESQTNQAKNQVEKFIKEFLNLISFGVNDQLNQEVKLKYFISSDDFKKQSIQFLNLENKEESDIQKSIIYKINDKDKTQNYNDRERKFLSDKSQLIKDKLNLNFQISYKPFLLFLILQKIEYCEQMRPLLDQQIYNDFSEQNGQNNQQAR